MAKRSQILADTDILIKIYRGDAEKSKQLLPVQDRLSISVITVMELYNGITDKKRRFELSKNINTYQVINLSEGIGTTAVLLIKKYLSHSLSVPDAIIAATAIKQNLKLLQIILNTFLLLKNWSCINHNYTILL